VKTLQSVILSLAVLGAACSPAPTANSVTSGDGVTASVTINGIRITNNTATRIGYEVSNPRWLGLLGLCNTPDAGCLRLAAGATVVVPFEEIHGYESGQREALIHWWTLTTDASGRTVPDPRQIRLPLQ
jgi:hypothetical protein